MLKQRIILRPIDTNLEEISYQDRIIASGGNSGNLVFCERIKKTLRYDFEIDLTEFFNNLNEENNNSHCLIPSSTFIGQSGEWLARYLPRIEKSNIVVTFAGLGIGGDFDSFSSVKEFAECLNPQLIRLFHVVSERAYSIGVRGIYSAEVMDKIGIHNIDIIGCPSYYSMENGVFTQIKALKEYLTGARRPKIAYCANNREKRQAIERIIGDNPKIMIRQMEFKDNSPIFYSIDKWNDFIIKQGFNVAIGSRFHGMMQFMLNGVPSLWITHDTRTRELTQYLKLPNIDFKSPAFSDSHSIDYYIKYMDYSEAEKLFGDRKKTYNNFLVNNGFTPLKK